MSRITEFNFVRLTNSDGSEHEARVDSLVAEAFVGPRPSSQHVLQHINGIDSDDRAVNLRWVTPCE